MFWGWTVLGWPLLVGTWFKDSWDVRDALAMSCSSCGITDWVCSFGSSGRDPKSSKWGCFCAQGLVRHLPVSCLLKPVWSKSRGQPGVCVGGLYQRVWVEGRGNLCPFLQSTTVFTVACFLRKVLCTEIMPPPVQYFY